jgi:MFS family permease
MTSTPSAHLLGRPTKIRYVIIGVVMLAAVLLYLERVCLSVAEVYVREDLGIGEMQMELAFGAFFIAYALGQVPSGWMSQRFGPRVMMALYMLGWSIFGIFIALAQDFWTLFFARFLLGLSQAGAYPTAALLIKRWVPDRSRGIASGIVAFGGRFGGAGANWLTGILIVAFVPITAPATVTPADLLDSNLFLKQLAAPEPPKPVAPILDAVRRQLTNATSPTVADALQAVNAVIRTPNAFAEVDWSNIKLTQDGKDIRRKSVATRSELESQRLNRLVIEKAFPGAIRQLHTDGWRPTLLIYGGLGIVVGGIFWVVVRNWPWEHPWANAAEITLIKEGQHGGTHHEPTGIPLGLLIRSRNQWFISAAHFFSNVGWVFLLMMPRFLEQRYKVPVDERGLMTTIPFFAASFGLLAGGWFTDRLTLAYGRRWGRSIPMGLFKLPCAVAMISCIFLPGAWEVTIALTLMAVFQDFGNPAVWAFAQDTGGKQVGAVLGWGNMWGNFGAGITPWVMGHLARGKWGWDAVLIAEALAFVLCATAATLANANKPLFAEEKQSAPTPAVNESGR